MDANLAQNDIALEFCEGTMINMFFNHLINDWEVSTKGNIGARCKFYQDHPDTFRTMFIDGIIKSDLQFSDFDKKMSYSFILQHPRNRIVVLFKEIRLVLVNSYKINGTNIETLFYGKSFNRTFDKLHHPRPLNEILNINELTFNKISDIFTRLNLDYQMVGAMFIDTATGMRTKLRNPTYEYVRNLKGNSPKSQFRYYELRKLGKVREYLEFYPESRDKFNKMRNILHIWTNTLHHNYISCYIKKEAPLKVYPYEFRPHMFALHQKYLNEIKPYGYVSRNVVIDYVNNLETPRLLYVINYNTKKKLKDEKKIEIAEKIRIDS